MMLVVTVVEEDVVVMVVMEVMVVMVMEVKVMVEVVSGHGIGGVNSQHT